MIREQRQLLLKDLCARLPYGVKISNFKNSVLTPYLIDFRDSTIHTTSDFNGTYIKVQLEDYKIYLRPMSSMTEEEKDKLKEISSEYLDKWMSINDPAVRCELDAKISSKRAEFYNSHYLDWNGLIEKGVALEAPEDIYKI